MIIILGICLVSLLLIGVLAYYRMQISFVFTFVFLTILFIYSGTFIVREGQQAVITQFGEIIGKPYVIPGLYLKLPFLWRVHYFDRRLLLDGEYKAKIPTKDSYFIHVDSVFNWKIVNATKFINTMRTEKIARRLLKNIVSGEVRQSVSELNLVETIRTKNLKKKVQKTGYPEIKTDKLLGFDTISVGRDELARKLTRRVNNYVQKFGIKVEGVFILDIKYQPVVLKIIYSRMIMNKLRSAAELRSTGRGEHERIMGLTRKIYSSIIAPAIQQALLIIGDAEAKEAKIKAKAFGQDIEFYKFWRTLDAYKRSLPKGSQGAIFSTDSSFLELLSNIKKKPKEKVKTQQGRK